jgi:hypothetical protein
MPGITPSIRLYIAIAAGVAGVISAALTFILQENLVYLIKKILHIPPGEPPPRKHARIWVAYILSVLVFVLGGALAALEPQPRAEKLTVTSPVEVGSHATVTIKTQPGTGCNITYYTPKGNPSASQELTERLADGNGLCTWSWQIGTNTTPGKGRVIISVGDSGETYTGAIEIIAPTPGP